MASHHTPRIFLPDAEATDRRTADGWTIYDLFPRAEKLFAVAGPYEVDPHSIDPNDLPDGFRWIDHSEWDWAGSASEVNRDFREE